ncbi:MAG: hypothetical protein ACTSPB_19870, partial [Candidatus Thorarchaeota archaeon]
MRRFLILILMLTALSSFAAAATITFYFYDIETSQQLTSVNVTINSTTSYILDSGGSISLAEGQWNISISRDGYEGRTLVLNLTGNATVNVYLEPVTNQTTVRENATAPAENFQAPEVAMNVTGIFTKWLGGEY